MIEVPEFVHVQVGMSMAQIGEFAFVLLSRASNLHLVEVSNIMYFCNDGNYLG